MIAVLTGWDEILEICISFMAREIEHFFMYLLAILLLPLKIAYSIHVPISALGFWFFGVEILSSL
jgi:hypothetical protein